MNQVDRIGTASCYLSKVNEQKAKRNRMVIDLSNRERADLVLLTSGYGWGKWFIEKMQSSIPTFSKPTLKRMRSKGNAEEEYIKAALGVLQLDEARDQLAKLKKAKRD